MKKALITGISRQDDSYLAELLLTKDYEVYGVVRRSSSFNTARLDAIYQDPHVPHARLKLVLWRPQRLQLPEQNPPYHPAGRNLMGVIRGSCVILNAAPWTSLRCASSACWRSAPGTMVRNLRHRKRRLFRPTRS
jgi:hypothetical protein